MKKTIILVVFTLICLSAEAQTSPWQWARTATNIGGNVEGYAITTDLMGNVYATGGQCSDTYLIFGNDTLFDPIFYLVKYDSSGNEVFARGASGNATGYAIATDMAGNIYVAGKFSGNSVTFGTTTLSNTESAYIFLVKYNSSGVAQWVKGAIGNGLTSIKGVATDVLGNVFITGITQSNILIFGSDTLTKAGNQDLFIVKYDSSGNVLFTKTAGSSTIVSWASSVSICTDISGNAYIVGGYAPYGIVNAFITFDTITLTDSINAFMIIVKYSPTGSALWARKSSGYGILNWATSISDNNSGYIYATGIYSGPSITFGIDTIYNNCTTFNAFFVKYDSLGNVIYAKDIGGTNADNSYSIATDNDDNVYITGEFVSPFINFDTIVVQKPTTGIDPMFFAEYNSTGHALFAEGFPSGGDDQNAVATDNYGNAYISGDFMAVNPFIIGIDSLPLTGTFGGEAFFVAKFRLNNINTGISEINSQQTISLYPNPTSSTFTLSYNSQLFILNSQLKIYDVLGQEVYTQAITNPNQTTINVSLLSNGVYFYQLTNNTETYRGKFVKE